MNPSARPVLALLALGALSCNTDANKPDSAGDSATTSACTGPSLDVAPEDTTGTVNTVISPAITATGRVCAGEATLTWTLEAVPMDSDLNTGDLNTDDPQNITFTPDAVGTYVLGVVVSDDTGAAAAMDLVSVVVTADNSPPVADCGDNLTSEANQRVDFDGSASRDPEGAELAYSWALSSVPECSANVPGTEAMFNGTTATPSMVPDCAGVYVVALVVSDGDQWSEADYCSVTVSAGDEAPLADAGISSTLSACAPQDFELNGFGSYDPEGQPLSYQWSMVAVPSGSSAGDGSFSDRTSANPTFAWDVTGTYTFQLQVHDGTQYSAPDIVNYTFVDEDSNNPPVANAGEDETIDETTECETASYEWTCEDCEAVEFDLDGSASDDSLDGDELDFLWTEATDELTFASAYSAITTATTPSFASEYGTAVTRSWEVQLAVSDCADSDTDTVTLTYSCTGEYSP